MCLRSEAPASALRRFGWQARARARAKECERRDSNSHGLPHRILSPARLPVPPLSHKSCYHPRPKSCLPAIPMLPAVPICTTGCSAGIPTAKANRSCPATRRLHSRFRARRLAGRCASRPSMRTPPPFARRARPTATAVSCRSSAIFGWRTRARSASNSSGSRGYDCELLTSYFVLLTSYFRYPCSAHHQTPIADRSRAVAPR
jgi:hypothetical protein